jgi:hypothetical protein
VRRAFLIGKVVLVWAGIVIAAQIVAGGPANDDQAEAARFVSGIVIAPGVLLADQLAIRSLVASTSWEYPFVVVSCSVLLWASLTVGLLYLRSRAGASDSMI